MAKENTKELLGVALQEFAGFTLMIMCTFPFVATLGDTWSAWIAHFFLVMLCDIISGGAQVNPSVSVAMYVYGAISGEGMIIRIIAQLASSLIAFPLCRALAPTYVDFGGPMIPKGVDVVTSAMSECVLTFFLLLVVYFASQIIKLPGQRPIIAAAIRALICLGKFSGPAMNPAIAFGYAVYEGGTTYMDTSHYIVYWIAPTVGAVAAAVLFANLQAKMKKD